MDYGSPVGFGRYLFVGGVALIAVLSIAAQIYNMFSHNYYKKDNLKADAKIVDVKRETVGAKNNKKICTTVIFDDGFEFVSHKTDRDDSFFSYRIQVTEATAKEILDNAMEAHTKACQKAGILTAQTPCKTPQPVKAPPKAKTPPQPNPQNPMDAPIRKQMLNLQDSLSKDYIQETNAYKKMNSCPNQTHNFIRPFPLTCKKCGLTLQWDSQYIEKYMGSYFDGVSYQWTRLMRKEDIRSFSVSCGNRPVFSASCDFSRLTVRNSLHGSRDGWMQSQYPSDYFDPKEVHLETEDVQKLRVFFEKCNFSAWKTPTHYVENHNAPGFSVDKRFCCMFADGKQFACLDPNNAEFDQLVALVREITEKRAPKEDKQFIERILEDTSRKKKQIYWLISQSLEEKWMELMAQGAPFFNYIVARELSRGDNANAELMVNVIRFSHGAAWVTKKAVPESEYQWEALPQGRGNDAGAAFTLLTQHFETLPEPGRKLFPIVALVLDGPITDDWLAAQERFQSLPGVNKNVLTIALVLGDRVEKKFLKKFDGVVYHINSMEDIINEMDSPLFGF